MNPFVKKHLDDITQRIEALDEALRATHDRIARAERQRQEALESQLKHRKELVTLQHKAGKYDSIRTENEQLADMQRALHDGLRKLLALTKALATEMRS